MTTLHVVDHALLAHRLAELRDAATPSARFRKLLAEIGAILTLEATRDLPRRTARITTPLIGMDHQVLATPEPVLVAVLRAGLGLMEGGMQVLPEAPVGHVGLVRDEHTLKPSQYMLRMPPEVRSRGAILFDPMLATGGSAVAAVQRVKEAGAPSIRFVCVVAAPEGVARLSAAHPDVPIYTASLDEKLDHRGFIVPGLGDAGDRCFGTEG
ncbi:uracil phosphoribosyltransferase [Falsiroseomonas sp.]|uniref:uracil phosphoribosyltransferase n=1 Tax=Falsiroseomonas sp. TaxID=2870721 RepID=UPI00271D6551|nr:uracil phosphoribosyltransferase [Falsiroseomonas sp.]MDO9503096.1 uracil phosphoribosyltransferase [Falsiroseomonas sp.]